MAMSGFRGLLFAEVFGNIRTKFAQNTGSGQNEKAWRSRSRSETRDGHGHGQGEANRSHLMPAASPARGTLGPRIAPWQPAVGLVSTLCR